MILSHPSVYNQDRTGGPDPARFPTHDCFEAQAVITCRDLYPSRPPFDADLVEDWLNDNVAQGTRIDQGVAFLVAHGVPCHAASGHLHDVVSAQLAQRRRTIVLIGSDSAGRPDPSHSAGDHYLTVYGADAVDYYVSQSVGGVLASYGIDAMQAADAGVHIALDVVMPADAPQGEDDVAPYIFKAHPDDQGYWLCRISDGAVYAYGSAKYYGGANTAPLGAPPVIAFTPRTDGMGYWVVDSAGEIYAYGSAKYYGGSPR
jgi:hypothetical protein